MARCGADDRDPVDLLWRPARHRARAKVNRCCAWRRPLGRGAGGRTGLGRNRHRRHCDGLGCRPHRGPANRDLWRVDDRTRSRGVGDWAGLDALPRARALDRLFGRWCPLSATPGLYQPLVRPPPRHCTRADLIWAIHRRGDLAVPVPTRTAVARVATSDADLRRRRSPDRADGAAAAATASARSRRGCGGNRLSRHCGCAPKPCRRCCAPRRFCAACRWRCRRATSSRFAAISASPRRRVPRCCRCRSAALF